MPIKRHAEVPNSHELQRCSILEFREAQGCHQFVHVALNAEGNLQGSKSSVLCTQYDRKGPEHLHPHICCGICYTERKTDLQRRRHKNPVTDREFLLHQWSTKSMGFRNCFEEVSGPPEGS